MAEHQVGVTEDTLAKLRLPLPVDSIEWRLAQAGETNGKTWGKALAYVTNRAVCDTLDDIVGMSNWKNEFKEGPGGGVLCGISVLVAYPDGTASWLTKWDGAENTDIEGVKGGLSGASKRSASTGWGIGRYLYDLPEGWVNVSPTGSMSGKTKEGKWFKFDPPTLPPWALPKAGTLTAQEKAPQGNVAPATATPAPAAAPPKPHGSALEDKVFPDKPQVRLHVPGVAGKRLRDMDDSQLTVALKFSLDNGSGPWVTTLEEVLEARRAAREAKG